MAISRVTNSLLIITGSMGAGKTSAMAEASDLLKVRHIPHAAIDVDALGVSYIPSATDDGVMYVNLRSVCENYAALGVQRFLLACAIENLAQLEVCRDAVAATDVIVCRLIASVETMQQRVAMRETGMLQRELVSNVVRLNDILDRAQIENFTVSNDRRLLNDAALEMLLKAGWISSRPLLPGSRSSTRTTQPTRQMNNGMELPAIHTHGYTPNELPSPRGKHQLTRKRFIGRKQGCLAQLR